MISAIGLGIKYFFGWFTLFLIHYKKCLKSWMRICQLPTDSIHIQCNIHDCQLGRTQNQIDSQKLVQNVQNNRSKNFFHCTKNHKIWFFHTEELSVHIWWSFQSCKLDAKYHNTLDFYQSQDSFQDYDPLKLKILKIWVFFSNSCEFKEYSLEMARN